ncbi:MAG: hypothetical protein KF716_27385 [Anaerolineae bacterium]|nr:hypothetical protein [Anaerolineae bacterium]
MQISEQDKQRLQHIATLIENGQLAEAKSLLTEFLRKSPNVAPAWYLVSFISSDTSKKQVALERALAIDPNYAPARNALTALRSTAAASSVPRSDASQPPPASKSGGNIPLPIALLVVVLVLVVVGGGVFLITKPGTVSDVKTFVATVRATPIGTPLVFSKDDVRGEGTLEIHASSDDLQANGRQDFTVRGLSSYTDDSDFLALYVRDDHTLESWRFIFYLSTYMDGYTYNSGLQIDNTITNGKTIDCPKIEATYKIEKQNTDFVITFSRTCNEDSRQWLDGVLRFRPNNSLTPTPTIPADQVFEFNPYIGNIRLELNSSAGDPLGEGKGDIVLETTGELQRTGESKPNGYKFSATTAGDKWELLFWARVIQLNTRYEAHNLVYNSGHGRLPEMNIRHPVRDLQPCPSVHGFFTVEQQSPSIIISFEQHCNKDTNQTLRGRLIFTPDLNYATPTNTPTPTRPFYPSRTPGPTFTPIAPSAYIFPTWTPMPNTDATSTTIVQDAFTRAAQGHFKVNNEWIGRVARFNSIEGDGYVTAPANDKITIIVNGDKETWVINLHGAQFVMGQTYEHVPYNEGIAGQGLGMSIAHAGGNSIPICETVSGSFRFDQQGSDLVLTFTHVCVGYDLMSVQGTIRFTPN